jgi:hypothetical protein
MLDRPYGVKADSIGELDLVERILVTTMDRVGVVRPGRL